jgi:hypothetical protein
MLCSIKDGGGRGGAGGGGEKARQTGALPKVMRRILINNVWRGVWCEGVKVRSHYTRPGKYELLTSCFFTGMGT